MFHNVADESLDKDVEFSDSALDKKKELSESGEEEEEGGSEEAGDKGSISTNDDTGTLTLYLWQDAQVVWVKLSHIYAILSWISYLHPDVRRDVKERFDKSIHKDIVARILVKLCARIVDVNMAEIINTFWNEYKIFVKEIGIYSKRNIMWNVRDVLNGKSTG